MRDWWCAAWMARSALVASQRRASKPWTNGWRCCEELWKKTTAGWTCFWQAWNNQKKRKRREEKNDEQADFKDGRRHPRDSDPALRRTARSRVPRPHRSEAGPEMDAWSGRLDDARLHQRG